MLCIVPLNHPFADQTEIRVEQLADEPFITNHNIKCLLKEIGVTIKNTFDLIDDQAIIAMVENELGISVMAELVLQGTPYQVKALNLEPEQHRLLGVATLSLKTLSPAAEKFIEYIKTQLDTDLLSNNFMSL